MRKHEMGSDIKVNETRQLTLRLIHSLSEIAPEQWNSLAGDSDPFVEHAFLSVLEDSKSVSPERGWQPMHLTVWCGNQLLCAVPLYLKNHSFGEYIFDWSWAEVAQRIGQAYYPKLVSMVPFTPATGTRILLAPQEVCPISKEELIDFVVQQLSELGYHTQVSSFHWLFLSRTESQALEAHADFFLRLSMQFHWFNYGYRSFDEFLGRFRSSSRKQIKRERRKLAEESIRIEAIDGVDFEDYHWHHIEEFYRNTCDEHGSPAYLTSAFFQLARERLRHRAVGVFAYHQEQCVAGTLSFEKGKTLYGRYWGCSKEFDFLHFELCYYQLIERAIEKGFERFEAGAQGMHKLRRGLVPSLTYSVHWIRDPSLQHLVRRFLVREREIIQQQMADLTQQVPFSTNVAVPDSCSTLGLK